MCLIPNYDANIITYKIQLSLKFYTEEGRKKKTKQEMYLKIDLLLRFYNGSCNRNLHRMKSFAHKKINIYKKFKQFLKSLLGLALKNTYMGNLPQFSLSSNSPWNIFVELGVSI